MRKLKKGHETEQKDSDKENIYNYLDENLSLMNIFNDESHWREFLLQNTKNKENQKDQDRNADLAKLKHEITYVKHFLKDKEQVNSLIKSIAKEIELSEEDILKLVNKK